MTKTKTEHGGLLKCSFCGKSQRQTRKIIAGPGVYICDECVRLCDEILEKELGERPADVLDDDVEAAADAARQAVERLRALAQRASRGEGGDGGS